MWERIRTAIILLVIVGVAMFATREPILMLPLLLVGAGFGAFEWSKLMPSLEQNLDSYVPPTTQIPTKPAKPIDYMYTLVMLGIVSLLLVMAKLTGSIASWVFF